MDHTVLILGVNHRTAPVGVRERLAFSDEQIVPALQQLKLAVPALDEIALVSTCNRVEVVGAVTDPARAAEEAMRFLAADRKVELAAFEPALYRMDGREAVRHLFRVGASLDSMVVGEPQILGQLKVAYAQATEAGTVGLILHRAFHRAFSVAKRVRQATLIGHGSVSVSSAAVALAGQIFDRLDDKTVMLMGAGKMAELAARKLKQLGIETLLITNRTFDRAVALARELGGTAVPFDNYRPYLKMADVVIGSLSATKPVVGREELESIVRERRYRPMFIIDMGVPRNFDERLNEIDNVYLYDIDDLGAAVSESQQEREREAVKAEQIVELELDSFWRWLSGLDLVPAIKDIRSGIEAMREAELARHRGWLEGLSPEARERVELLTHGLVNKILHGVLAELRRDDRAIDRVYAAEIARRLLCGELAAADVIDDDDDFDDEGS